MKNIFKLFCFSLFIGCLAACKKGGLGGDNTLVVYPFHHATPVPYTIVYIKYGAGKGDFPGTDVSVYDDHQVAMPRGPGENPSAIFPGLKKGNYFLWGVGYDSTRGCEVQAGQFSPITKSGETDVDLGIDGSCNKTKTTDLFVAYTNIIGYYKSRK